MSGSVLCFRIPLLIAGGVLLWLGSLSWPVPPAPGLDASWQQVLGYAREQRLALGSDIVFTYGPWGWLSTLFCHPSQYWPRFVWELIFKGALAAGWMFAASRIPWWRGLAAWLFGLLLLPFFSDTPYFLLIAGPLLWLGFSPRHRPAAAIAIGAWLGFLAMQKFTLFVMTGAGIGGLAACLWFRYERRTALLLPVSWTVALLTAWLAAGQAAADLPLFLQRSFAVASAYQEAMFFNESSAIFWIGLATAGLAATSVFCISMRSPGPCLARFTLGATCLGLGFLAWKHGFVRADGHVLGFFYCTLAAAILFPLTLFTRLPLALVSLTGIVLAVPTLVHNAHGYAWLHLREGFAGLAYPVQQHENFVRRTTEARHAAALPTTRTTIGSASMDVFGHEQSAALLNELNFRPRPVFQGYQTCSPPLAELNAAWFASPAAPDFVLARMESIDGRLPALDDARLMPLLLTHYRFVCDDASFLVLRRETQPVQPTLEPTLTLSTQLKELLTVPASVTPLWMTVDIRPSLAGRLRAFFYKPAEMLIHLVLESGETREFRFNPTAAAGGFLLTPFLPNTEALKNWLVTRTASPVRAVSITPARHRSWFFQSEMKVSFAPLLLSTPP